MGSIDPKRPAASTVSFNDSSFTIPNDAYSSLSARTIYGSSDQPAQPQQQQQQQWSTLTALLNTLRYTLRSTLNTITSSPTAQSLASTIRRFASTHPHLTALLVLNLLFSGPAILLFALVVTSSAFFALFWGLLLGLLGAGAVIAAVLGLALCVLVPVLCFTVIAAGVLWAWGCVGWWVYGVVLGKGEASKEVEGRGGGDDTHTPMVAKEEESKELVVVKEVKAAINPLRV